jgi:hypothetical protein
MGLLVCRLLTLEPQVVELLSVGALEVGMLLLNSVQRQGHDAWLGRESGARRRFVIEYMRAAMPAENE